MEWEEAETKEEEDEVKTGAEERRRRIGDSIGFVWFGEMTRAEICFAGGRER